MQEVYWCTLKSLGLSGFYKAKIDYSFCLNYWLVNRGNKIMTKKRWLMPCPITGPKMFCAGPIFSASPKIWLHLVPIQKLLRRHKKQFYWMQIIDLSCTKCLWLLQYVDKLLVWHKRFGPAQNILGPVKGQSIKY